jgi:hypothetical protein
MMQYLTAARFHELKSGTENQTCPTQTEDYLFGSQIIAGGYTK